MKAVEGEKAKAAKEAKEPTVVWRKRMSSGGVAKGKWRQGGRRECKQKTGRNNRINQKECSDE